MTTYKITNQETFNENAIDVCCELLTQTYDFNYRGTLTIETENDSKIHIHGEHFANEYETDYGFIIVEE